MLKKQRYSVSRQCTILSQGWLQSSRATDALLVVHPSAAGWSAAAAAGAPRQWPGRERAGHGVLEVAAAGGELLLHGRQPPCSHQVRTDWPISSTDASAGAQRGANLHPGGGLMRTGAGGCALDDVAPTRIPAGNGRWWQSGEQRPPRAGLSPPPPLAHERRRRGEGRGRHAQSSAPPERRVGASGGAKSSAMAKVIAAEHPGEMTSPTARSSQDDDAIELEMEDADADDRATSEAVARRKPPGSTDEWTCAMGFQIPSTLSMAPPTTLPAWCSAPRAQFESGLGRRRAPATRPGEALESCNRRPHVSAQSARQSGGRRSTGYDYTLARLMLPRAENRERDRRHLAGWRAVTCSRQRAALDDVGWRRTR